MSKIKWAGPAGRPEESGRSRWALARSVAVALTVAGIAAPAAAVQSYSPSSSRPGQAEVVDVLRPDRAVDASSSYTTETVPADVQTSFVVASICPVSVNPPTQTSNPPLPVGVQTSYGGRFLRFDGIWPEPPPGQYVIRETCPGGAPVQTIAVTVTPTGPRFRPGVWGDAQEVPGTGRLDRRGSATAGVVSCTTAKDCGAGGWYNTVHGPQEAFVDDRHNGRWRRAQDVPNLSALNAGGLTGIGPMSCFSPGNCSAGGSYINGAGQQLAFVVTEVNGIWGLAQQVPGLAQLDTGASSGVFSVSCGSRVSCAAGGFYTDSAGNEQAFVVSETSGSWGTAAEVPGTARLNTGGASVSALSCALPGDCAAVGTYTDPVNGGQSEGFVVSETNGSWGTAAEVPGTVQLNAEGTSLTSVSCESPGNCAAVGEYTDGAGQEQGLVVIETNGIWGLAQPVPGLTQLNTGGVVYIDSVSCASPGYCGAGGYYTDAAGHQQGFVVTETNGTWDTALEVPGLAQLNAGGSAGVQSVSCPVIGYCSAGGSYLDAANRAQAFVINDYRGRWLGAAEVPGTAALNAGGYAQVYSVSCATADYCSAVGEYADASGNPQAFVVDMAPLHL